MDEAVDPALYVAVCVMLIVRRRYFAEQLSARSSDDRIERLLIRAAGGDGSERTDEQKARRMQRMIRRNEMLCAGMGALLLVAGTADAIFRLLQ